MTYPDLPNPDLLERIPHTARSILDVGCGTAALGALYRVFNARARIFGMDTDAGVAELAASRCDLFAIADAETDPLPFGPDERYDCIIYGDVLEHMRDPWSVIARQAANLTDDGVILICVPNVEHWSFAAHLLRGSFDYADQGLFDRTHLRWFSGKTMRRGLSDLGLFACDIRPRIFEPERAGAFADLLEPALDAMGIDKAEFLNRAAPLQYIWRVRKAPPSRLMVAANMLKPVGGVSDVRVLYPLAAMATDPDVSVRVNHVLEFETPDDDTPRVAVLHRPILTGEDGLSHVRRLIVKDWLVVTEFDDHPDHFPALRGPDQYAFSGVHAVQTTTEPLAGILRERNPEVMVFPNAVRALPEPANFQDPDRLTLFFGALNREPDWAPLMDVLNAVAQQAGDRLNFQVVHDQGFFDALTSPHKRFTPTCDHATYMTLLGGCELSLMPLADTPFNRAKSDLKFIEAGACRAAALASHVVYGASVQDGRTGLLFSDAAGLWSALMRVLAMPETAREIGETARRYVAEERMLAYQTAARIGWYRDLWSRREALTAALLARVPALAEAPLPNVATAEFMTTEVAASEFVPSPPMMAG